MDNNYDTVVAVASASFDDTNGSKTTELQFKRLPGTKSAGTPYIHDLHTCILRYGTSLRVGASIIRCINCTRKHRKLWDSNLKYSPTTLLNHDRSELPQETENIAETPIKTIARFKYLKSHDSGPSAREWHSAVHILGALERRLHVLAARMPSYECSGPA